MKISAIECFTPWVGLRNQLLVKVTTDDGIYGWGESGLSGREQAVIGAIAHYREFLIGRDPQLAGALWQEMYRSQYFEGGRVLTAAIGALDIAFHDIRGKALGVPVHQLLGGKHRDHIPAFATAPADPGPAMLEQAHILKSAGWNCIRFVPWGQQARERFEPTGVHGKNCTVDDPSARGTWPWCCAGYRLSSSPERGRSCVVLSENAVGHLGFYRRAHS